MVALGGIIGSAYFLGSGYTLGTAGPGAVLSFAFAGVLVFLMMMCLGELSVAMPVPGSLWVYLGVRFTSHCLWNRLGLLGLYCRLCASRVRCSRYYYE